MSLIDDSDVAPCRLLEHEGGTYSLTLTDFDATEPVFAAADREGGGYSWHGVVDAWVRMHAPHLRRKLNFDPEAGMFAVASKDLDALRQVAAWIRRAQSDTPFLQEGIENTSKRLAE